MRREQAPGLAARVTNFSGLRYSQNESVKVCNYGFSHGVRKRELETVAGQHFYVRLAPTDLEQQERHGNQSKFAQWFLNLSRSTEAVVRVPAPPEVVIEQKDQDWIVPSKLRVLANIGGMAMFREFQGQQMSIEIPRMSLHADGFYALNDEIVNLATLRPTDS